MAIIEVDSLTKKFGPQVSALKNVTLQVKQGELLALVGESGSGKTTLLRLLAGLEQPDGGSIKVSGNVMADHQSFVEPESRSVGMIFQDYALFPHMNIYRNVAFGLYRSPKSQQHQRVEEVLELVGLSGLENRFPHQLSGGQQQRVAIARALAPRPSILLLDEPFSNLDTLLKDQVRDDVRKIISRSQLTAILVTHDIQDALSMADRIALLKQGVLQQLDTPHNLYHYPLNTYVAKFMGPINLIPAQYQEGCLMTDLGKIEVDREPAHSQGLLCLRPRQIWIDHSKSGITAEVVAITNYGDLKQIKVKAGAQTLWCSCETEEISIGEKVPLRLELSHPHMLKAD